MFQITLMIQGLVDTKTFGGLNVMVTHLGWFTDLLRHKANAVTADVDSLEARLARVEAAVERLRIAAAGAA